MIQRVQSVYLSIAALLNCICVSYLSLWQRDGVWIRVADSIVFLSLFILSAVLAWVAIFLFQRRKLQLVLNRINLLLNLVLLGLLIDDLMHLPGGLADSHKGVGLLIPLCTMGVLVMANQCIKRDEALVKSVDRIR
ncbi:MAG: DUF4293 family protein [Flavobacteriales bacterium]